MIVFPKSKFVPNSTLLYGETLVWVTFDRGRVVSAAVRAMLQAILESSQVRIDILQARNVEEASTLVEQQRAGLLTLVLQEDDEAAACKVLRRVQVRRPECVRCVYFPESMPLDDLRLLETGAQIVVHEIPCLQRLLPGIIAASPRRAGGSHPLTTGLADRLPWG